MAVSQAQLGALVLTADWVITPPLMGIYNVQQSGCAGADASMSEAAQAVGGLRALFCRGYTAEVALTFASSFMVGVVAGLAGVETAAVEPLNRPLSHMGRVIGTHERALAVHAVKTGTEELPGTRKVAGELLQAHGFFSGLLAGLPMALLEQALATGALAGVQAALVERGSHPNHAHFWGALASVLVSVPVSRVVIKQIISCRSEDGDEPLSAVGAVRAIAGEEGLLGFFKGMPARLLVFMARPALVYTAVELAGVVASASADGAGGARVELATSSK